MRKMLIITVLCALGACAVIKPPPGGPEDRTPPRVVGLEPAPDSAGVARDAKITIIFSEKVDGDSFRDRVRAYPPLEFEEIKVKGNALSITFREAMPETTICVVLRGGYRDYHGVENKQEFLYYFATDPTLAGGEISGMILFKNRLDSTGVAKIFPADSSIDFSTAIESRIAYAGPDGAFLFRALPTDSARFILWAFSDANGDGTYSDTEFSAAHPDTIVLTEAQTKYEEIMINIIDPDEPGTIEGVVLNETGLPRAPTILIDPLLRDEKPIVILADSTGGFSAPKVPPGSYTITVFIDMSADSLCGSYTAAEDTTDVRTEPCLTSADTLVVKPGEKVALEPLTLREEREEP